MDYVTHDELIELIELLLPFFAFLYAVALVVCFHIIKCFIDNVLWFFEARAARLEGIEDKDNVR